MRESCKVGSFPPFFGQLSIFSQSLESLAKTLSQTDFKHLKDGFLGIPDNFLARLHANVSFPIVI